MNNKKISKQNKSFFAILMCFAIVCIVRFFDHSISEKNLVPYSISYKNGFTSGGIIGTIWKAMGKFLGIDLTGSGTIYKFSELVTAVFYLTLISFFVLCIKKCREKEEANVRYMIAFMSIFAFTSYLSAESFGDLNLYMMIITLICVGLIVIDKWVWLVVPLCCLAVCIHYNFVFMNANIIFVLLIYQILTNKTPKKYKVIFFLTVLSMVLLLFFFSFFSHLIPAQIQGDAAMASQKIELLCFIVLFSPYLYIALNFFRALISGRERKEKIAYVFVAGGALMNLAGFITGVKYGRGMLSVFSYYIIVILSLVAMNDKNVGDQLENIKIKIKDKLPLGILVLIYPMIFMPFGDTIICDITEKIRIFCFR